MHEGIRKIVIVGGGAAGWMAACAFSRFLRDRCEITLVESEEVGALGLGESTLPQIRAFNRMIGADEDEFVRRTKATFKLGIEFRDWGRIGDSYIHPFGPFGMDMEGVSFHAYWLRARALRISQSLDDYSLQALAARHGKFMRPIDAGGSPLSKIVYAFQFDAVLFASFLREYAEGRGVRRQEGKVVDVRLHPETGFITSVEMANGASLSGDLFVDCSGFHGVLLAQGLGVGYEDWSHWLPCDRAVAVPSTADGSFPAVTQATARTAGWQWRIPLQHRVGAGHVYSSAFMSDDEATSVLLEDLGGEPLATPRQLRFNVGRRQKFWEKNCVAFGLSAGFMEPLEAQSIHLIQTGIASFLNLFPDTGFEQADIDRYNEVTAREWARIRDFLTLHYYANQRDDSPFWAACRDIKISDYLQEKIRLFESRGRIFREDDELFSETSWFSVFVGQHVLPRGYDPLADMMPENDLKTRLSAIRSSLLRSVEIMPKHGDFIEDHCSAPRDRARTRT